MSECTSCALEVEESELCEQCGSCGLCSCGCETEA